MNSCIKINKSRKIMDACLLSIILASLLFSSCRPGNLFGPTVTPSPTSTTTPTSTPKPTEAPTPIPLPSLQGKLVVRYMDKISIFQEDIAANQIKGMADIDLTTHKFISLSNDHAFYQKPDDQADTNEVFMMDLSSLETKTLSLTNDPHPYTPIPVCASLSGDKARLSFRIEGKLSSYDFLTGASTGIAQSPSALYDDYNYHYGALNCGYWIGEDALLFDRYVGGMPYKLTGTLGPNTLTIFADGKLRDNSEYTIHDVSRDGMWILLRKSDEYYITQPFGKFEEMDLHSLDPNFVDSAWTIGTHREFTRNNKLFVTVVDVSPGDTNFDPKHRDTLYIMDPQTLQIEQSYTIPPDWPKTNSDYIWVGDPTQGMILFTDTSDFYLGDFNTGLVKKLISTEGVYQADWVP